MKERRKVKNFEKFLFKTQGVQLQRQSNKIFKQTISNKLKFIFNSIFELRYENITKPQKKARLKNCMKFFEKKRKTG
jgi:hypothetical protein